MNDPRLPTRSGRFENRQRPARSYTESQDCHVERDSYRGTGFDSCPLTKLVKPGSALHDHQHVTQHGHEDISDFTDSEQHDSHIRQYTCHDCCRSLAPPVLLGSILLFRRHKQVQSPMASSSTADVLDEATTTLIVGIKNMKESKTPQQIEDYIHKLQSLGRHMQLQQFRTWLKDQCGLPIAVRPSNLNTQEYMSKEQIEQWIEDWTKQNAQGNEQRVLKNFLLMDFAVQPNQKNQMQPCSNCEQPFMLFMLLPMKQHNMNMYDPDEHKLFCYNCCTEVGQMLHPGRYVPPDQQAIERQKGLNQNPPGFTMTECELRALSGDRGYIPPTWYLATPPGAAVPPDHAIIIHRWDTETSQWIKLPLTKVGEDHEASQYSPHEWQLLVKLVLQTRKAQAQQGLQTHRSTTYKSLRDALIETQPNLSKRKAKMALLDHQEFLATQAGTDLWTLEPQQLQRLVKAFQDWEKVNFTQMVTGHNNGLLDYLEHKDSIAHLQDFLDVVLPNLHQHYICRSTDCSFVTKASHWINSATPDKQGKYLCPRCRTEYRPWAATAVNNPNKKFCPAAQCLVTKVTSATPPEGFKDILDWLRANDMGDLAIKVAEMGIDDMDSLRAMDLTTFQEHGLDHLSTRRIWECLHGPDILVIHESETVTSRHDLPVVHARGRGSMKRALDRTITNDEDQLIIDLENDMYAHSSKKPREALWKTWCVMASAWNLPPVPLTEELILKVGASFKAGQYRSPQNYFSRAVQEHRSLTKANPSYFLQQLIKNTTRSIVRGMGPTPFKDSFEVELLCRICPYNLPTGQETWLEDPAAKIDATLICCWWLLRGIEAAAATTLHVWHQTTATEKTTLLTLPVQKTDSAGACVARGHSCICLSARHFQRICPHHAMKRHLDRMLRRFPAQYRLPQGMPLIPNASGHTISQDQLIQIFRDTIQLTGTTMERPGPAGDPRPRFSQHTCTIPYQIGLLTRGGPTHWPLGLRCHQTLHPRSPIATPTCSQPQGTSSNRDDQPTSPYPRPTRSTSPPTPVLDLQPNDQGLPCASSSRNMHRQCPMGNTLWMELWNIPLPQTDDQTHGPLLRQVQVPGQHQRDRTGLRGRQLRDLS